MKKVLLVILIIFSIINCQSDYDKLNVNENKVPSNDTILKAFTLKVDKNYFLVNDKVKINVNYEFENKQDNKDLVLRIKSVGEDILKHQINGVDFIFGKNDVKEKQYFFDNTDNHMYLTPKKTGYLDLEFSGQLYDTVKKEYVGKPIISKISLVSLKIDLLISNYTSVTDFYVQFDDGIHVTDNFISTEHKSIEGFDLIVIVDDSKKETIKNIDLYKYSKIFNRAKGDVPKKIDIILKQRLSNGKENIFKFNDIEFKLKEARLKSFGLELDKNYSLVNKKVQIKVNYKIEDKEVNNNLVLKIKPLNTEISKQQFSGFIFTRGRIYLRPKKIGYLNLEFYVQLYDSKRKEYVGKPFISKIGLFSLKIDVIAKKNNSNLSNDYIYHLKFNKGDCNLDNFLSTEPDLVEEYRIGFEITHASGASAHYRKYRS